MPEFLKALVGKPRFTALLVTLLVAVGAKVGVDEQIVQLACDVAFAGLAIWLGIEITVAKQEAATKT